MYLNIVNYKMAYDMSSSCDHDIGGDDGNVHFIACIEGILVLGGPEYNIFYDIGCLLYLSVQMFKYPLPIFYFK